MRRLMLNFYVWLLAVFFGSILSETIILYPNIFHDVPASFELAMNFLAVVGPHHFFTAIGSLLIVTAVITNTIYWSNREVRPFLISSFLLLFVIEFLFSILFFWPRNTIMFVEGSSMHSVEKLKRVANEFLVGHGIRVLVALSASVIAFLGLLRCNKTNHQRTS